MAVEKPLARQHEVSTVPPPVGGLNARDPLSLMPATDAVRLVNWIPDAGGLRARKGYRTWAKGFPDGEVVKTVMSYLGPADAPAGVAYLDNPTTVAGKLFAVTDRAIYEITDATNEPEELLELSEDADAGRFSHVIVSNAAGTFLCAVSEKDGYFIYNGAVWEAVSAGSGAGELDGATPADLCFVTSWKRRLWFVQRNSTSAFYGEVDAITGDVTEFDFGSQFKRGGSLSYLTNWTIDAGEGIDDLLIAVSSNGEVVVYKGTDPSSATTFGKVGTFFVGQIPVGRRGFCQYGGDLLILSANGLFPVSYITRGGAGMLQASETEYSAKVRSPLGASMRERFYLPGWDVVLHPAARLLIVGQPDSYAGQSTQFVMSTVNNAWTTFEGIPATCYGDSMGLLFAGTKDGRVVLLFSDFFDDIDLGARTGVGIRCVVQPAFQSFNKPALEKQFLSVRPCFLATDAPRNVLSLRVNFDTTPDTSAPIPLAGPSSSLWDTALWDVSKWGGGVYPYNEWMTAGGQGFVGTVSMTSLCVGDTSLVSIDYMVQVGGPGS